MEHRYEDIYFVTCVDLLAYKLRAWDRDDA